jgi:hypothetical protein
MLQVRNHPLVLRFSTFQRRRSSCISFRIRLTIVPHVLRESRASPAHRLRLRPIPGCRNIARDSTSSTPIAACWLPCLTCLARSDACLHFPGIAFGDSLRPVERAPRSKFNHAFARVEAGASSILIRREHNHSFANAENEPDLSGAQQIEPAGGRDRRFAK